MATTISNPAKIRTDKAACHHQLSAQVFGTEKEGEPDGQKGAAEKHHPDDRGHMPSAMTRRSRRGLRG
jgi:hypothetical protein